MTKYKYEYIGGPLDGQFYETDNLDDYGTSWSYMDAEDGSGRYYIMAARSDPYADAIWEDAKR